MLARVEAAFAGGQREVMLVSFPSDFCTDAGRRINDRLPGRQDALPAGARAFLAFWRDAPRPGGFGPGARVRSSGRATPTLRRTTGRSS
jgi:hypothetical protein